MIMKYYDQHLHTYFSFDSEAQFEDYLQVQPEIFVTTEHFDLKNPCSNFKDDIPDYKAYVKKLHQLEQLSATRFLKGIELGMVPSQLTQIEEFLAAHPYDLKVVSIHQNGQYDFMDEIVLKKEPLAVAQAYFQQMETVLAQFSQGDILAHFDYGLRRFQFTPQELASHFEGILSKIIQHVISYDMAIELNAKSFTNYQNSQLYHYFISLYLDLGGKLFTLGSDAHVAADYQKSFTEMGQMLRNLGVQQLVTFQGNERTMVDIP